MPQKGNNWIIPLLLALAISAGAVWYYFFRLKPPLESSLPLTNNISPPPVNENPNVNFSISTDTTDPNAWLIGRTVKKYVWSPTGEKVLYPGSESGRPWLWGNAIIQGITEYIPGVPWDKAQSEKQTAWRQGVI
jgi:hypothetical protein